MFMKRSRQFNILDYMFVQIKTLTAEPLRTRRIYFLFGGEYRQTKTVLAEQSAFPRLLPDGKIPRICSRRDEVSDPIAVSRWDQKKNSLCALCDSAVNLILRKARLINASIALARMEDLRSGDRQWCRQTPES